MTRVRFLATLVAVLTAFLVQAGNPADYVNPFIGASTSTDKARSYHGLGKTFPGATTPYGLVQLSPNTVTGGDNGSGYSYEHKTIEGFAFTQMSGVGWYGDLGNLLVMPSTGKLRVAAGKESSGSEGYRSHYSKETETASAGFYSVELTDYTIKVEATATPRCGILRFTFPQNEKSRIQIDLARRVGGTSVFQSVELVDKHTIQGWMKCTPDGGGWGNGDGKPDYTVYFYARFSKAVDDYGFWSADIPDDWGRKLQDVTSESYLERVAAAKIIKGETRLEGKHIGFFTEFATREKEKATLKVGISFVDIDGAKKNFEKEIENKDFDRVRKDAEALWNTALSAIEVEGGSADERTVFYTALYHTMIDPRVITDVDGRYPGANNAIYHATDFSKRTIFSGWDVFRSQFPLQTIINPRLVSDQIQSLVSLAEQSGKGYLERWEFFNAYSGCMVGNPAISVLTDAYAKGIRNYDVEKAYRYAVKTSEKFGAGEKGFHSPPYSISNTLEYAYSDWCLAQLAKALGKPDDEKRYLKQSQYYRNVYDQEKGWFRPKKENGEWEDWPEKGWLTEWYGCVESNPYQQGWFVPHDVEGLVELIGGREKAADELCRFFDQTPDDFLWNDYYNHANEPVHHAVFLFNRIGFPWLTQKWSRLVCANAYKNAVEGLVCNEDVGQMSAWYVLAAIGIHPVCPGETRYELTSPVFDKITIKPGNGKKFIITATNNSDKNRYIQQAKLNGKTFNRCHIDHSDLINGGALELKMGESPNKKWGI